MGVAFSPDNLQLILGGFDHTIRVWSAPGKWQKPSQQITGIHLSPHPAAYPDDSLCRINIGRGRICLGYRLDTGNTLLLETNISINPIHLLQFSQTQLILSTPDGSMSSWNLVDGKPIREGPINRGPHLDADSFQLTKLSNSTISWFPFDFNAGLWAYVDGRFIRFEGEDGSVTITDVKKLSDLDSCG